MYREIGCIEAKQCLESSEWYNFKSQTRWRLWGSYIMMGTSKGLWKRVVENNVWVPAKESLGRFGLKQHKHWFGEECSKCLD
jgi:hypothetical protein